MVRRRRLVLVLVLVSRRRMVSIRATNIRTVCRPRHHHHLEQVAQAAVRVPIGTTTVTGTAAIEANHILDQEAEAVPVQTLPGDKRLRR